MPPCESIITYETTIVVHCVYVFVYLTLAVIPHLVYLFDILFGVGVIVLSPTFCSHSVVLQPLLSVLTSQFNIFSPFTLQGKMFFQARLFSILSPTQFLQFLLSNLLFVKLRPLLSHVIPVMCVCCGRGLPLTPGFSQLINPLLKYHSSPVTARLVCVLCGQWIFFLK